MGACVRKSRQKEAAGAADAGHMQVEWSQGEGVEVGGSADEAAEGAREGEIAGIDDRRWCERESGEGIGSRTGRTRAERR
jgi:hypothetical protein